MNSSHLWYVAFGGLIAGVCAVGMYDAYTLSRARRTAQAIVQQTIPYQLFQPGDRTMIVVGDSTAFGVGAQTPEETTAGRVALALSLTHVENYAKSGARANDLLEQIAQAKKERYDIALVQAGANDVIYFTDTKATARALDAALAALSARADTVVFLSSGDIGAAPLWPRLLGYVYTYRTKALREEQLLLAQKHGAHFVDIYALPDPFAQEPETYYALDGLHPSGEGYAVWARYIIDKLVPYAAVRE